MKGTAISLFKGIVDHPLLLFLRFRILHFKSPVYAPVQDRRVIVVDVARILDQVDPVLARRAVSHAALDAASQDTGLPSTDPVRFGPAVLLDAIESFSAQMPAKC